VSATEELGTATELLARLRGGKLGSLELLEALLARIERHNGDLNAVVALDPEGAREAARAADATPAGRRGPLHGLPMTIKDSYEVAGMPATCGFPHLAGHVPVRDADAVARLRAAGAIPFGKTNVPLAAADHQSYNPVYGTTNNPWDATRTPGGSSGGAAAALAAGFTPLELGSDIGGSIRIPAHFCGVYGHKPSYGMVPLRGHIPPDPGELLTPPLSVAGPLARSAADLELALDVLAPAPPPPSRHERLADFRVALWADGEDFSVDARCLQAMREFADDLRRLGVTVDEAARPELDVAESDDLYVTMLFAAISAGMPEEVLAIGVAAGEGTDPRSYPARIARALRLTYHEFVGLQARQLQLQERWRRFFERYDVVLCPVTATVAFPHDHSGDRPGFMAQYDRTHVVDGAPVPYMNGLQWSGLVLVANLPATVLPTGRMVDGLPMGVQAVGPFGEDRTPLRFAALAEREIAGFQAPPSL
jgi:amidase